MTQERQADEDMMKFFNKLLDIKQHVLEEYKNSNDERFKKIYDMIDETIKLKELANA